MTAALPPCGSSAAMTSLFDPYQIRGLEADNAYGLELKNGLNEVNADRAAHLGRGFLLLSVCIGGVALMHRTRR
jgi:hypothetical protein